MKIFKPSLIRTRVRNLAGEGGSVPVLNDRQFAAAAIEEAVSRLFPSEGRDALTALHRGRHLTKTNAKPGELAPRPFADQIAWNTTLLLGYLFCPEDAPFRAVQFKELGGDQWRGLCRWCGIAAQKPRPEFLYEAIWLANRGLWAYVYNTRFWEPPAFCQILEAMETTYETNTPGVEVEPGGMVETCLTLEAEPLHIQGGEKDWVDLMLRFETQRQENKQKGAQK